MSSATTLIREKGLRIVFLDHAILFSPEDALDDEAKAILVGEAKALHKRGVDVRRHLVEVVANKMNDPGRWERLHRKLAKQGVNEGQDSQGLLVSWVGAQLRMATASRRLGKPNVPANERGGRLADLTWSTRLIPSLERRLVAAAILSPSLQHRVMALR